MAFTCGVHTWQLRMRGDPRPVGALELGWPHQLSSIAPQGARLPQECREAPPDVPSHQPAGPPTRPPSHICASCLPTAFNLSQLRFKPSRLAFSMSQLTLSMSRSPFQSILLPVRSKHDEHPFPCRPPWSQMCVRAMWCVVCAVCCVLCDQGCDACCALCEWHSEHHEAVCCRRWSLAKLQLGKM